MKVITYSGYSRMKNFGDWWLYEIINQSLSPTRVLPLDRVVARYGLRRFIYKLWQFKVLPHPSVALLGGGTLFPIHLDFLQHLESVKCKKYSVGTGAKSAEELDVWNLINSAQKVRTLSLLDSMTKVTVRGPISENSLRTLGYKGSITIVGDPMLSWFDECKQINPVTSKTVLLNIANLDETQGHYWRCPKKNMEELYEYIIDSYQKANYKLKVFYCAPEDREICIYLAKKHGLEEPVSALEPQQMTTLLQQGRGLIATRLHAMVYAIIRGFPTVPLAYQDKHIDFLTSVGLTEGVVRLKDLKLDHILDSFESIWAQQHQEIGQTFIKITQLNILRDTLFKEIISSYYG